MKTLILSLLTFSSIAAQASFLDGVTGPLNIGGDKCAIEGYTITSAYGQKKNTALTIYLKEYMEGIAEIETAIHFGEGSGSKKHTQVEGDIIPLPVTYRTVWNTDEAARTSEIKQYEGVGIALPVLHHTLKQVGENLYVWTDNRGLECYLSRK
ncbi:hypothetical protein ACLVWU_16795 [Bdellovibrio sp. HCB290]|uniref:hypothetical protein n=1 Tax=Bdellovibrio sp. HCB290 TaxID=3394356 RepID=UPI0039B6BC3E